jgi:L-seryl-tRNA(Ser) seleniumtransferase
MRSDKAATSSNGGRAPLAAIVEGAVSRLTADTTPSLRRLINATGVVVHTNLGRAPLSPAALAAVQAVASGYSNLEYDERSGERGHRETHIEAPLRRLLAAEGAAVVNNCAAAVLLAVNTFAEGRHVLVSRGELVEIGGSFRIPDILRKGGATLREVGTTNRTRLSDYQNALDAGVGLILRVHPSNFRIVGFTESPASRELADLARSAGIPLVEDLGSGLLEPPRGLESEATVRQSLEAGADVVTFSGDKLFGGPQAGLAVGHAAAVDAMRRNPLYRALRVDKMTIAALHATLVEHESERAPSTVPVLRMVAADPAELRRRAGALADRLRAAGVPCDVIPGQSAVGGGAAPTVRLETSLVSLAVPGIAADDLAARLRSGTPPVVGRIEEGRLLFDPRTVDPGDEETLGDLILGALKDVRSSASAR